MPVAGTPLTVIPRADVQGSIRARGGIAWDRALIYATGGATLTGITNSYSAFPPNPGFLSFSRTRAGWTVGGGVGYAITNNWSVLAEYRYADFGPTVVGFSVDHNLTENQVQVGFNYKFDTFAPTPVLARQASAGVTLPVTCAVGSASCAHRVADLLNGPPPAFTLVNSFIIPFNSVPTPYFVFKKGGN